MSVCTSEMPKPRIGLYNLSLGETGGIERMVFSLATRLKQRGCFEPVVICTENSPFYQQLRETGIQVAGIPFPNFLKGRWRKWYMKTIVRTFDVYTMFHLVRMLPGLNLHLIHTHHGRIENLLFKLLGFPLIYTFHGYGTPFNLGIIQSKRKRWLNKQLRPLFRWMVPFLDELVIVSRYEQQRLIQERFIPHDIPGVVIPNGLEFEGEIDFVQPSDNRADFLNALNLPSTAKLLTFVGRLDTDRNLDGLLDFIRQLLQDARFDDVVFVIAGIGPLEQQIVEAFQKPPFQGRSRYLGYIANVPELLSHSECSLNLSLHEGFGLWALESLAMGTPCVGYRVGGLPEVLGDSLSEQLLSPTSKDEMVKAKILALQKLDIASRQSFRRQLINRAKLFTPDHMLQAYEDLYRRVLCSRNSSQSVFEASVVSL